MSNNNINWDLLKEGLLQNLQTAEDENEWDQVRHIHDLLDEIAEEEYGLTG
jgi:hypothetical protein